MSTSRDDSNAAKNQQHSKVLLSKEITNFVNIFRLHTKALGNDQRQLADCVNPLSDFGQHNDKGETWLNRVRHSLNLRTPTSFANFSANKALTDDSVIKIGVFLTTFYEDNPDSFKFPHPFILAVIRDILIKVKEAYQNSPSEYKGQLEILKNVCHAVVDNKNNWVTAIPLLRFYTRETENTQFTILIHKIIHNINIQIEDLAQKCKSQQLRDSANAIDNILRDEITPNLRGALLHFIFSSAAIPQDLFTDTTIANLFNQENLTWDLFRKTPRLKTGHAIFKFIKTEATFTVVKDYFFAPTLQKLRCQLDDETKKARKQRLQTTMRAALAGTNRFATTTHHVTIEEIPDDAEEQDPTERALACHESSSLTPHFSEKFITDEMRKIASYYKNLQQTDQRVEAILNALPYLFKKILRPSGPFSTSFEPPCSLFFTPTHPEKSGFHSLKKFFGKARDVYIFAADRLFYLTLLENNKIQIEKLSIGANHSLEELKKALGVTPNFQDGENHCCIHARLKLVHLEAISRLTGHCSRNLPKDIRTAIILENYLYALNDTFDDLYRVIEIQSNMQHIVNGIAGLGNTIKFFAYQQCLALSNDLRMAKDKLAKNLIALRSLNNDLETFDLQDKNWSNSSDTAQSRTEDVMKALGKLETQLLILTNSLTYEQIDEDLQGSAEAIECLIARLVLLGGHPFLTSAGYPILDAMTVNMHLTAQQNKAIQQASSAASSALMSTPTHRGSSSTTARSRLLPVPQRRTPTIRALEEDEAITYEELLNAPLPQHPQLTLEDIINGNILVIDDKPYLEKDGVTIPLSDQAMDFIRAHLPGVTPANTSSPATSSPPSTPRNNTTKVASAGTAAKGSTSGNTAIPTATPTIPTDDLLLAKLNHEKSCLHEHKSTIEKTQAAFDRHHDFSFQIFRPSPWWLLWLTGIGFGLHCTLMIGAALYRWINEAAINKDLNAHDYLQEQITRITSRLEALTQETATCRQQKRSLSCDETENLLITQLKNEKTEFLNHQRTINTIHFKFNHSDDLYHRVRKLSIWWLAWITGIGLLIHIALLLGTALQHYFQQEILKQDAALLQKLDAKKWSISTSLTKLEKEVSDRQANIEKGATEPLHSRKSASFTYTRSGQANSSPFVEQYPQKPTFFSAGAGGATAKEKAYADQIINKLLKDSTLSISLLDTSTENKPLLEQLSSLLNRLEGGRQIKELGSRQRIYQHSLAGLNAKLGTFAIQVLEKLTPNTCEHLQKNFSRMTPADKEAQQLLFKTALASLTNFKEEISNDAVKEAIYDQVWKKLPTYSIGYSVKIAP
jgi:hypothetical protein